MTDQREADRRARVKRITTASKGRVITAAELMRRHGLPATIEDIESGRKRGTLAHTILFTHNTVHEDGSESTIANDVDV